MKNELNIGGKKGDVLVIEPEDKEQAKQETDFSLLNPFFEDVLKGKYS